MSHSAAATVRDRSDVNESTDRARTESLLTPRFYTTDFDAIEAVDVDCIREEWDALMDEFRSDNNKTHFRRDEKFESEIRPLSDELREEFIDFMISSVTSEYSGHVLYNDIARQVDNPDMQEVFEFMARDEARHAGFINGSLRDFDLAVDLSFLRKAKKYKYFKPKFIYYATYLSEKIGYARYITIYRQLERHPELRFHPIFRWFKDWCNDEFRHGEVFALLMKAEPKLLQGHNKLWIRFFMLAVFATMYVRDHMRPELHKALGFDPTEYDRQVLRITSEISEQIFPVRLDLENPRFWERMDRLVDIGHRSAAARAQGGVVGWLKRGVLSVRGAATFLRLLAMRTRPNARREDVRLAPSW